MTASSAVHGIAARLAQEIAVHFPTIPNSPTDLCRVPEDFAIFATPVTAPLS